VFRLKLRKAKLSDCDFLLQLRNEPRVRQNSLSTDLVKRKEHKDWFLRSLNNSQRLILVAEFETKLAGMVRFDRQELKGECEISIAVSELFLGHNLGWQILSLGIEFLRSDMKDCCGLVARVKDNNVSSHRLFQAYGFNIFDQQVGSGGAVTVIYRHSLQ